MSVDLLILDSILQVLNTGGQLTLRAAPAPPPGSGPAQVASPPAQQSQQQVQQPNNRIMAQQQQQNQYAEYQQLPPAQQQPQQQQQQQNPVYQQPHQHHSANELYEMYDEYATGSHPNSNHYSDGGIFFKFFKNKLFLITKNDLTFRKLIFRL